MLRAQRLARIGLGANLERLRQTENDCTSPHGGHRPKPSGSRLSIERYVLRTHSTYGEPARQKHSIKRGTANPNPMDSHRVPDIGLVWLLVPT